MTVVMKNVVMPAPAGLQAVWLEKEAGDWQVRYTPVALMEARWAQDMPVDEELLEYDVGFIDYLGVRAEAVLLPSGECLVPNEVLYPTLGPYVAKETRRLKLLEEAWHAEQGDEQP